MRSQNIQYLAPVDHLRGLAALLIIFYHGVSWYLNLAVNYGQDQKTRLIAGNLFESLVLEGHTAVGLFMVLSGFIFTVGCYKHDISYFAFIKNRFLRTYPLYLFLLFFGISAYKSQISLSQFFNLLLPLPNLQHAIGQLRDFGGMFWAVAVEWQFYLVLPFILAITNRRGYKYLLLLIVVFIVFRNISYTMDPPINMRDLGYLTIAGRMDQFLLGILIGIYYRQHFTAGLRMNLLFAVATSLILCALYAYNLLYGYDADNYFKVFWPTIEGMLWAAFILGYLSIARHLPTLVDRLLSSLGTISYSMYLTHFIVILLVLRLHLTPGFLDTGTFSGAMAATALVMLPLTLALSSLTYFAIEKPFLDFRVSYKKPAREGPEKIEVT
jgi:peptidoglycan/LPS O-acetylase OafA/YrhL